MKASEARKLADQGGEFNQKLYNDVIDIVKIKARLGLHTASMYCIVGSKVVAEKLKKDGYKVELIADNRDGDYWHIEW